MSFEPKTIQSFVTLTESLSFTKAAQHLGVTQPYLSARIKGLESQLGFALFNRSSRHVEITPGGREFLEAAKGFLSEAEHLKQIGMNVRKGQATSIRIGAGNCHPNVRWSLLGQFMSAYPNIEVQVKPYQNSVELWAALRCGEVDVALIAPPVPDEFDFLTLSRADGGLLMRSDHPLRHRARLKPTDLAGQQIAIFARRLFPALYDQVVGPLEEFGAWFSELPETSMDCTSNFMRATGVPALGAPWWATEQEKPADLVHRLIDGVDIPLDSVLLRSRTRSSRATSLLWRLAANLAAQSRIIPVGTASARGADARKDDSAETMTPLLQRGASHW